MVYTTHTVTLLVVVNFNVLMLGADLCEYLDTDDGDFRMRVIFV